MNKTFAILMAGFVVAGASMAQTTAPAKSAEKAAAATPSASTPATAAPASVVAPAAVPATPACVEKALSKDGKPLSGAAKAASVKKCEADAKTATPAKAEVKVDAKTNGVKNTETKPVAAPSCDAKAVSKDGKALSGAAKAASVKKCEADAKADMKVDAPKADEKNAAMKADAKPVEKKVEKTAK